MEFTERVSEEVSEEVSERSVWLSNASASQPLHPCYQRPTASLDREVSFSYLDPQKY
jgi:hypothetical protein